jgi:hypothetical protein
MRPRHASTMIFCVRLSKTSVAPLATEQVKRSILRKIRRKQREQQKYAYDKKR